MMLTTYSTTRWPGRVTRRDGDGDGVSVLGASNEQFQVSLCIEQSALRAGPSEYSSKQRTFDSALQRSTHEKSSQAALRLVQWLSLAHREETLKIWATTITLTGHDITAAGRTTGTGHRRSFSIRSFHLVASVKCKPFQAPAMPFQP